MFHPNTKPEVCLHNPPFPLRTSENPKGIAIAIRKAPDHSAKPENRVLAVPFWRFPSPQTPMFCKIHRFFACLCLQTTPTTVAKHILNPVNTSRRTALIKLASVATSTALAPAFAETESHNHHELSDSQPTPSAAAGPAYFSQPEYDLISKLADLLIPRTDTPGAVDAGVPLWIDRHVSSTPALQQQFKQGLADLNAASFAALSEPQQIALLQTLSDDTSPTSFFKTFKDLTIDAYYSSEPGLVQELGYHGNTFRSTFPGCTHPEHWPANAKTESSQ